MLNDVIDLVTITTEQDADGFNVGTESLFHCFADVESARGIEYYTSVNAGVKVIIVATINYYDYMQSIIDNIKPSEVVYENTRYRITRTYRIKKDNTIELSLSEVE